MGAAIDTVADGAEATVTVTGIEWRTMTTRRDAAGSMLVDRDGELDRIGRSLADGADGRGRALVLEGPAGIGKTALLTAARDLAARRGLRVLRARVTELEQQFAFGVVRQLVEPLLAELPEDERDSLLEGPASVAAQLLGLGRREHGSCEPGPVAPDPTFAVLHGLYWMFANLAAQRPLALVVDDVHWADGASMRFLAFLLLRLEELRVAVLLSARPAEAGPGRELLAALMMDPVTEVVTLGPLTTVGVARVIAAALGREPEPGFAKACRDATGGNPFLVRTLVAALDDEGVPPVAASVEVVEHVAPASLARWATLQLGRLGADAARLARAVAILERAELGEAADLAGLGLCDSTRAADLLVRAGLLEEQPLAFAHPMLRTGVYRDIPVTDRARAHATAARILADGHADVARVAAHLLAADATGESWVVEQLRTAAREASASGAPECAVAYLRRAIGERSSSRVNADLLRELGMAEFTAGEPGWEQHLEAAVVAAEDDAARVSAGLLLATALMFHQRSAEAVDACDRVAARLEGGDARARMSLETMVVNCGLDDAATARSVAARAIALRSMARDESAPRHALAVSAYMAALLNEPAERAAEQARRAIRAGARELPDAGDPPWFPIAVGALLWTERYDEAQALLDAAVAEARAQANGLLLPPALTQRALLAFRRGDVGAAEADARALLECDQLSVPPLWRVQATGVLVATLVERGDWDGAQSALKPVELDLHRTFHETAVLRHARGRFRFARRRFAEALADFEAVGDVARRTGVLSPSFLSWRSDAALAHLALGDAGPATRLSEEELELARAFGAARTLGVSLRAAGLVEGGDRGERLLREAIDVLGGDDARLERAHALTDLGAMLRRGNRRVDARQLLREAVDAAHHLGAMPLAERAETELRATGAKPRRVLLTGLEALTASERRIAELAADGLSNPQIAQALFVTVRTVEGHLTNVFTKLDLTARSQLPAALRPRAAA